MHDDNYFLIIPASGKGSRMNTSLPKQYLELDNSSTILDQSLGTLLNMRQISGCVIAIAEDDEHFAMSPFSTHDKIQDWGLLLQASKVAGAARQLAEHCVLKTAGDRRLELVIAEEYAHLNTQKIRERLQSILTEHLGRDVAISITTGEPTGVTPAQSRRASEDQRMRTAREAIESDSTVQAMQVAFDAVLEADSIKSTKSD